MTVRDILQKMRDARNEMAILLNKLPKGEALAMAKYQSLYWGRMEELLKKEREK